MHLRFDGASVPAHDGPILLTPLLDCGGAPSAAAARVPRPASAPELPPDSASSNTAPTLEDPTVQTKDARPHISTKPAPVLQQKMDATRPWKVEAYAFFVAAASACLKTSLSAKIALHLSYMRKEMAEQGSARAILSPKPR